MSVPQSIPITANKSVWIEFIGDRSVRIDEGQTILEASLMAGIPHYHACGGNGKCSTCRVLVYHGNEFLSPPSEKEKQLRQKIPLPPDVRLACQTFVSGMPVKLHRIIRDEADMRLYLKKNLSEDLHLAGNEKEMALFFLDIRDFTPFMATYLPFDVIHIMRRLFALFRKAIEDHQGRIIDTSGDGFYAVFGFETDVVVAANKAYAAATSLLEELDSFNRHYVNKYFFHQFQVGIGLHAGKVIVGNIGIGVNNNITVMGLPVNIASRIQDETKSLNNNLVVSAQFYQLLSPAPISTQKTARLKGIEENILLHLCGKPYKEE